MRERVAITVLEAREVVGGIRDGFTLLLRKFKVTDDAAVNKKQLVSLLKSLDSAKKSLTAILKLLPKARLYVTDYRMLAKEINGLRAQKALDASPDLIVKCCMFVCNFTEPDFSERKFMALLTDFNPDDYSDTVKKGRK
ncbi:MAG: hypothetical protein ACRC13_11515 [Tannerellaceae bacterium]